MAISDRIQSIEEHIKESYQELEGIGIDTTEVDKNLENIPKLIDGYWKTLPKVTGEGTSITLNDTKEGKMKINLKGNTSQETTTQSKNLMPNEAESQTINGLTITKGTDGSLLINGTSNATTKIALGTTSLASGTYTLSTHKEGTTTDSCYLRTVDTTTESEISGTSFNIYNSNSKTYTLNESHKVKFDFYTGGNRTFTNFKIYPMAESGSTATDYVEFVPNSPSPDYPQDIHVVSGDNSIKVTGKNLLDLPNNSITSNGVTSTITNGKLKIVGTTTTNWFSICNLNIPLESGTYIFSYTNKKVNRYNFSIKYEDNTTQVIYGNAYSNTPITLNKNATITSMFSDNNTTGATFDYEDYLMLEKGTTATEYEEYKGASYPINLGVKNLWNREDVKEGFLPQSGSYPVSNPTYPNSKYVIVPLMKGQKLTLSGSTSSTGRVRCIDKDTNQVVNSFTTVETEYYITTHAFGDGFYEATITARKDFLVGIMDYISFNVDLVVNYGATPQTITDNPIELCKVGDYQDSIKKSTGKNLFDNSLLNKEIAYQATTSISNGVLTITSISSTGVSFARLLPTLTLLPNTQYTCSFDINGAFLQARIYDVDANNYTTIATSTSGSRVSGTFTTSSNTTYELVLYITLQQSCSFSKIQVEQGSIATEYEPYGTSWYLNKQIGKVVLNGSENWIKSASTSVDRFIEQTTRPDMNIFNGLSNYFTYNQDSTNAGTFFLDNSQNQFRGRIIINFSSYGTTTLEQFKTWLSNNNTEVYYVLATPTYTEITDSTLISQLEAVKRSYDGQTNISQENNDNASILNASALSE